MGRHHVQHGIIEPDFSIPRTLVVSQQLPHPLQYTLLPHREHPKSRVMNMLILYCSLMHLVTPSCHKIVPTPDEPVLGSRATAQIGREPCQYLLKACERETLGDVSSSPWSMIRLSQPCRLLSHLTSSLAADTHKPKAAGCQYTQALTECGRRLCQISQRCLALGGSSVEIHRFGGYGD